MNDVPELTDRDLDDLYDAGVHICNPTDPDDFPCERGRQSLVHIERILRRHRADAAAQVLRDAADRLRSEGTVLTAEGRRYCSHRLVEMAHQIEEGK